MRHFPAWTILGSLLVLLLAAQFRVSAGGAPGAGHAPAGNLLSVKGPTLFDGWPKPSVALVLTGSQDGYMEPCGCSGEEHKKGGLSRRDRFVQSLVEKQWPVVAMDVGSVVKRFGKQTELKYQAMVDGMKSIGYKAIGFGPADLRLSAADVVAIAAPVGDQPTPFVSANVGLFEFNDAIVPSFQVISAGGKRIGVTSVIGDEYRRGVTDADIQFKPADKAIAEVLPKLEAAKCDLLVLLANAKRAETEALAKKFPQFQVVVTSDGADEPPAQAAKVAGTDSRLIEVGHKGMYAIVLGIYDDGPTRYQRVPLDSRFGESERMDEMMAAYQDQLQSLGLDGLGLRPAKHPSGRAFVGSSVCGDCHTKAYEVWKDTPHAHALETLENLQPARQFDPECLSCHVTGWEPQKYFPFASGYLSREATAHLIGNGCENCHGPGSVHAAAEADEIKATDADKRRFRDEMRLTLATPEGRKKAIDNCLQCHDIDNSIHFKGGEAFDEYWDQIKHPGKD